MKPIIDTVIQLGTGMCSFAMLISALSLDNPGTSLLPTRLRPQTPPTQNEFSHPVQFMDYKAVHRLTSRRKRNNFCPTSICQQVHFFLSFLFSFSLLRCFLNTAREKTHFYFQFSLNMFSLICITLLYFCVLFFKFYFTPNIVFQCTSVYSPLQCFK